MLVSPWRVILPWRTGLQKNPHIISGLVQTTNLRVGRSNRSGRATVLRSPCFLGITRQFNSFVLPHWYQSVGSMVRVGMGLIKNEHGVYHVRRKVPKGLEEATARVTGVSKERVSWLKETLGTKDEKRAKVLAKPIMMEFDRIIAQAEALLVERPVRKELTEAEIKQIADYFYAHELNADEDLRVDGVGDDPLFADIHRQLTEAGIEFETPFEIEENRSPLSGLSDRMMNKIEGTASDVLPVLRKELARGDIKSICYEVNELLRLFRINLDPNCPDYRKLALAVTRSFARAFGERHVTKRTSHRGGSRESDLVRHGAAPPPGQR